MGGRPHPGLEVQLCCRLCLRESSFLKVHDTVIAFEAVWMCPPEGGWHLGYSDE